MAGTQSTGVKLLNDKLPPALVSAVRTDNTHITVTLSDICVNLVHANEGGFTAQETGSSTYYAVSATAQGVNGGPNYIDGR